MKGSALLYIVCGLCLPRLLHWTVNYKVIYCSRVAVISFPHSRHPHHRIEQNILLYQPHFRPSGRVLGRSILCGHFCEQPTVGVVGWHLGQTTGALAGVVWMCVSGDTVWVFPELWLGYGSEGLVGGTEWRHVWGYGSIYNWGESVQEFSELGKQLMFYYFPEGLWQHQSGFSVRKSLCNWWSWKVSG